MQHEEADRRVIGIDGTHPGILGEVRLGDGERVISNHLPLLSREGSTQLADCDNRPRGDALEVNVGGPGGGIVRMAPA